MSLNQENKATGRPSEERKWMQYYPEMMLNLIQKPQCTVWEYLESNCPGMDEVAIHYYGALNEKLTSTFSLFCSTLGTGGGS